MCSYLCIATDRTVPVAPWTWWELPILGLFLSLFFLFLLLRIFALHNKQTSLNPEEVVFAGCMCMVMQPCWKLSFRVPSVISACSGCWEMQVANMSFQLGVLWDVGLDHGNQLQPHLEVSSPPPFSSRFISPSCGLSVDHNDGIGSSQSTAMALLSKWINPAWFGCNFALFKEQILNKILRVIHI